MNYFNFTAEESALIAIYRDTTLATTLARITAVVPDMDADIRSIAENAVRKLTALDEPEFAALSFVPADDTEG